MFDIDKFPLIVKVRSPIGDRRANLVERRQMLAFSPILLRAARLLVTQLDRWTFDHATEEVFACLRLVRDIGELVSWLTFDAPG